MSSVIEAAARSESSASFRTSSATTANLRPCSPARKLVASCGRLVEEWSPTSADPFRAACAAEALRRAQLNPDLAGIARDVGLTGSPSMAAFMGARTAELDDGPSGYEAERMRQAEWLAGALHLKH